MTYPLFLISDIKLIYIVYNALIVLNSFECPVTFRISYHFLDYNVQSSQTAHERKLTGSLNAKENSQFTKGANVMTEEELNDGIEETSS